MLFNIKKGNPGWGPCNANIVGIEVEKYTTVATNNTVYGIKNVDGVSGEAMGLKGDDNNWKNQIFNNICVGNETQDFHDWGSGSTHSHNLSSDSSATGTGAVTGKSAVSLFVSTTTGSEDLSLISTASAIGAGKDLGTGLTFDGSTYGDAGTCLTPLNRDISDGNRDAFSQDWDIGAHQYAITAKIGTSSRDFSTINAWEAQLDNTDYYGKGSYATGECYDDTDFSWSGSFQIDGGATVDLGRVVLSAAVGQRHDGTAKAVGGSGVRILWGSGIENLVLNVARSAWFEWIDFDYNDYNYTTPLKLFGGTTYAPAYQNGIANCIVHDLKRTLTGNVMGIMGAGTAASKFFCNCIIYNIATESTGSVYGVWSSAGGTALFSNCTIYNIHGGTSATAADAVGVIQSVAIANGAAYSNNIIARMHQATTLKCIGNATTAAGINNLTTDATATGTDSIINADYDDLFESTTGGSEDLHLKNGSPALRAGDDLGTRLYVDNKWLSPDGIVNIDINGRDRHSEEDDWDIGAHQCEDCSEGGAVTNTAFMFFVD